MTHAMAGNFKDIAVYQDIFGVLNTDIEIPITPQLQQKYYKVLRKYAIDESRGLKIIKRFLNEVE